MSAPRNAAPPADITQEDADARDGAVARFQVLSDLHLDVSGYRPKPVSGMDAVIVSGDVRPNPVRAIEWLEHAFPDPNVVVLLVAGNHEFYGTEMTAAIEAARKRSALSRHVRFLECDAATVPIVRPEGRWTVRVLGATLWTDLRIAGPLAARRALRDGDVLMNDYVAIRTRDRTGDGNEGGVNVGPEGAPPLRGNPRTLMPVDTVRIHHRTRRWLARHLAEPFSGPTVVVTHHAAHPNSFDPRFRTSGTHPYFASDLSAFMEMGMGAGDDAPDGMSRVAPIAGTEQGDVPNLHAPDLRAPALWVHGHIHRSLDYRVGGTRVVCNPRGYPHENPRFEGTKVVAVPLGAPFANGNADTAPFNNKVSYNGARPDDPNGADSNGSEGDL